MRTKEELAIKKRMLLATLLGDNPNRAFTYASLFKFLRVFNREAVYDLVVHLRMAGMKIEVKNGTVTYMEN